jgi:hypothetical protein
MTTSTNPFLLPADTQAVKGHCTGPAGAHNENRGALFPGDAVLARLAADCGRNLEAAMARGQRDLALAWQAEMYRLVNLRRCMRFSADTQAVEVAE